MNKPDIEVRDGAVIAYFPCSEAAAYLKPSEARAWAVGLAAHADAAEQLASISRSGANPLT